ncbi:YeeE/YedE family protein [Alcanivorax sp. MM125-6]|nr:YeeE/YedE family protein [Alcanivorax sp. ZXX171]MCQ6260550.1 YeeE/YedE family protein [Alcanivorax sp. MM125-6]
MTVDWTAFTPWTALAGGLLIGVAASALWLLAGRIAGISGILGGVLAPVSGDLGWRLAFLAGLLVSPWLYTLAAGPAPLEVKASTPVLIIAGLLVGYGTRLGSGCTSGHGVCGLSRLSPRSLVATLVFMGAGFITVYVTRHMLGGL